MSAKDKVTATNRQKLIVGPAGTDETKTLERVVTDLTTNGPLLPDIPTSSGSTQLLVPGTYVPRVGLPPGVPYMYVIGNLLEGYPVDLAAVGAPLNPNVALTVDRGNYFGFGIDAIIGKGFTGEVAAYAIPAVPSVIAGVSPSFTSVVSADGTLFEISQPSSTFSNDAIRIREVDLSWSEYSISGNTSLGHIAVGEASDVAGVLIFSQAYYTSAPDTLGIVYSDHSLVALDKSMTVTSSQDMTLTSYPGDGGANVGVIENGWVLLINSGVGYAYGSGTAWARPSVVTTSEPAARVGRIFLNSTPQVLSSKNMSIGPTGVAWVSFQADTFSNPNTVVRLDLVTGQIQRFQDVLYDNTLTYPVVISDTLYISDSVCAVAGHYEVPSAGAVPIIVFVAVDANGAMSVNMLEFPEYIGTFSQVASMVKLTDGTLAFHLYSGALASTGQPANVLYGITEYP